MSCRLFHTPPVLAALPLYFAESYLSPFTYDNENFLLPFLQIPALIAWELCLEMQTLFGTREGGLVGLLQWNRPLQSELVPGKRWGKCFNGVNSKCSLEHGTWLQLRRSVADPTQSAPP